MINHVICSDGMSNVASDVSMSECVGRIGFSLAEEGGKLIDLSASFHVFSRVQNHFPKSIVRITAYPVFLSNIVPHLEAIPRAAKLRHTSYLRFVEDLYATIMCFCLRKLPVSNVEESLAVIDDVFVEAWASGEVAGWEGGGAEALETSVDKGGGESGKEFGPIDVREYADASALSGAHHVTVIKSVLDALGLKVGGSPIQLAQRLFLLKNSSLDELPKKNFQRGMLPHTHVSLKAQHGGAGGRVTAASAKGGKGGKGEVGKKGQDGAKKATKAGKSVSEKGRVMNGVQENWAGDIAAFKTGWAGVLGPYVVACAGCKTMAMRIALLEMRIDTLLEQVEDPLREALAYARQIDSWTDEERARDRDRVRDTAQDLTVLDDSDGDDDGDGKDHAASVLDGDGGKAAPIYNPKNVPLDETGQPIPYWLFKVHGLNHTYTCEICGGAEYRGRLAFGKHFSSWKHRRGLEAYGIPNTRHFHGIVSIKDAMELYKKLQSETSARKQFDAAESEECEGASGAIFSRRDYNDLVKLGIAL